MTAASLCRSDATVSFAVTYRYRAPTFPSAKAVARVWRRPGERVWVPPAQPDDLRLVAVGHDRSAPREVLVAVRLLQGWYLKRTVACLDRSAVGDHCRPERATLRNARYRWLRSTPGAAPAVGRILGQARQRVCIDRAGQVLRSRGQVWPITAYAADGRPGSAGFVVTRNRTVRRYVAVSADQPD